MAGYRLFVLHIQQGSEAGTDAWFHNPAAQVSAHFGNPKTGAPDQWVDTGQVAWAEANYNAVSVSVENEGKSGESLTSSQLENAARILAWCHTTHGIKLQVTDDPNGEGVIGHGLLGVAGGDHPDCPGAPILAQRQAIVERAKAILSPTPTPTPQETDMARLFDVQADPADPAKPGANPGIWAAVEGIGYVHVQDPAQLAAYRAGGTPEGVISFAQHQGHLAAVAAQRAVANVTVDATQLTGAVLAALSDPGLLAKLGAALAHAEAVQQHTDTPAS
jgi:hypothetical protein